MIPKVIHYCWFGGKPIPKEYQRYIESWRQFMPDYEVKEWNEGNYDVNCIDFSKEAYSVKKYAYVSDYARLKILYENGGVYFDTDVEVIHSIDDIVEKGNWMAFEKHVSGSAEDALFVNVGLGFACERGNAIIKEIMEYYEKNHYIQSDGKVKQIPIVYITTEVLKRHGLCVSDRPVTVGDFTIYPWDYFCPMEYQSNKIEITENARTIHHYSATWMSKKDKFIMWRGYFFNTNSFGKFVKSIIGKFYER